MIKLIQETIPGSIVGTVVSVTQAPEYTCDVAPVDGGATFHDVRLKVSIDGFDDGQVSIPANNSLVIISPLNQNRDVYYVSRFSKVIKWHLKVDGNGQIEVDGQGNIKLNGELFGGIGKTGVIAARIAALEARENVLTAIVAAIASAATAAPGTPVTNLALSGFFAPLGGSSFVPTTQADISNNTVKHG